MICQQRFLPYWAAVARSAVDATLIRQVVGNANIFTGPEPGRSFGANTRTDKSGSKSHKKPRKSHNPSVKEDARPERPQKSP